MNQLGAVLYDPGTAVSFATTSNLAMTAFDTSLARVTVTAPASGKIKIYIRCTLVCAATTVTPGILLGILDGSTVRGRVVARLGNTMVLSGAGAGNVYYSLEADFTITGLTPGTSYNLDAAYGVELLAANTAIKIGGPNNSTTADAYGGLVLEAYDPQPLPTATAGAAGGVFIAGTNAATTITAAAGSNALTLTGGAASGATPAGHGLKSTGGAASTTGGGTAGTGFNLTGGAGAATTNGAAEGFTVAAGGTTTVSGANAASFTGSGALHGVFAKGGATGNGLQLDGGGTSGVGLHVQAIAGNSSGIIVFGSGNQDGIQVTGGATGNGLQLFGGGTSGDGVKITTTAGHGFNTAASGTNKHGIFSTGGTAGTSDGIKAAAGTGGVDIRGNITGNLVGTVSTVTTVTNQLTAAQVATGVWQDATSGDFTVSSSIGKSLYTTGNAPGAASGLALVGSDMGTVTSVTGAVGSVTAGVTVTTNNDKTGYSLSVTPPTAATIATTVWTDLLASSDFSTASSIGKLLKDDIDATISSRGTGTGTALTSAQVATAVWTDTTAGDFTTALSIGKSVMNGVTLGTGLTINAYTGNTVQTGDSYAIVNSSTFGNAKLVRSTTPANTLDVSATGEAGVDWANVGGQSTSVNLSGTTTNLVNTLTAYTGNTPQTGDGFARIGSTGSGLTSLAPSATALSTAQWSNTLATNLGTLAGHDPGSTLASHSDITGLNNLSASQVENAVWDGLTASHSTAGSFGLLVKTDLDATVSSRLPTSSYTAPLDTAGTAAAVWNAATVTYGIAGSYGLLVETNLDAAVSSRMASYTQPTGFLAATFPATVSSFDPATDVVAHVTLVDTTTDVTNAVTIGDVTLAASQPNYAPAIAGDAMTLTAAYDAAKTAAQASTALSTAQWTNGRAANLDNLNATVSSRLAASSYTAPDNAGIAAIEGKTNNLPTDPASTTDVTNAVAAIESHGDGAWLTATGFSTPADVSAVAGDVWDVTLASHLTPGSTGEALNAAGSAGDPWVTALPGAYAAGSAGSILGNNLNAPVTAAKLAADGLDAISVADPGAPTNWTTLPKMLIALVRRMARSKVVKDATAGEIRTYADNGTTVNATQAFTVTASTETLEEAT